MDKQRAYRRRTTAAAAAVPVAVAAAGPSSSCSIPGFVTCPGPTGTPVRCSIVVTISACHAEDPGSIPGRGKFHVCGSLSKLMSQLPLQPVVIDSLAEWSKAPGLGPGPKGRGFKPHSCHTF